MEPSLPIEKLKTFDCYHDSLTHHFTPSVFYDALQREISFAFREGKSVGVLKFQLLPNATEDQLIFFANELEIAVRQHDLIARIAAREFAIIIRFNSDIPLDYESLVRRIKKVEKRGFLYAWIISDGTKGLEQVLEELDNPQILKSSETL